MLKPNKTWSHLLLLASLGGLLFAADAPLIPPLPAPVTNNAVAAFKSHGDLLLFSFMGMGPGKTWDSITNAAYVLEPGGEKWLQIHPVLGPVGRIAASAISARDQIFLFGGYAVEASGRGTVVPDVSVYEPSTEVWARAGDIPVPVADTVIGVYRDRYVYLVGGRSNTGVVPNVQLYDAWKNKWSQATPLPGTPVFGHAGALIDDTIIYIDGAYRNPAGDSPRYLPSDECWIGKIDRHDPAKIIWSKIAAHPGSARFRIAAGGAEKDRKIFFAGGTSNPYDISGIGYDGKPAEPSASAFAYDLRAGKWEVITDSAPNPTMDHHGLIVTRGGLLLVGGMEKGQKVSAQVTLVPVHVK